MSWDVTISNPIDLFVFPSTEFVAELTLRCVFAVVIWLFMFLLLYYVPWRRLAKKGLLGTGFLLKVGLLPEQYN